MRRKAVNNPELARWRSLAAADTRRLLADYDKQDRSFIPRPSLQATRWNVRANGVEFQILCTGGPKYLDTRGDNGGGGTIKHAMHLLRLDLRQAVAPCAA